MQTCHPFAFAFFLSMSLAAAQETARDFDKALVEHEQALAAAEDPVHRRYQSALASLLARARREGDVDTAARAQQALDRLAARGAPVTGLGLKAQYLGAWDASNPQNDTRATRELDADGGVREHGRRLGSWDVKNAQLIVSYDEGRQDRYAAAIQNGVLTGKNFSGLPVTLTRRGITSAGSLAASIPTPKKGGSSKPSYFGTAEPVNAEEEPAPPAAPAPEASPASTSKPAYFGTSGAPALTNPNDAALPAIAGLSTPSFMPAPAPEATADPSAPTAAVAVSSTASAATALSSLLSMSPVGTWKWHARGTFILNEAGSVLSRNSQPVAKWVWSDRQKGEIKIKWPGAEGYDVLTLSADGQHMTNHTDTGETVTEDRVK